VRVHPRGLHDADRSWPRGRGMADQARDVVRAETNRRTHLLEEPLLLRWGRTPDADQVRGSPSPRGSAQRRTASCPRPSPDEHVLSRMRSADSGCGRRAGYRPWRAARPMPSECRRHLQPEGWMNPASWQPHFARSADASWSASSSLSWRATERSSPRRTALQRRQ